MHQKDKDTVTQNKPAKLKTMFGHLL